MPTTQSAVGGGGTISVRITAHARVEFAQRIEITPEQFAEYERLCEANDFRKLDKQFGDLIDPSDILDMDDLEQVTVERVADKAVSS